MENEKSIGEKWWVFGWRTAGVLIGLSPFIPNLKYYWGWSDAKIPVTGADFTFILVGFLFVWGSGKFGSWANTLGKITMNKIGKK